MSLIFDMSDRGSRAEGLAIATQALAAGKLVGIPTETVYGLGANALDGKAARRVFRAKGRTADKPLIVLAGKDYGMGSSRDWAAKGSRLLGIRAVLAESFERIHRSNLIGMGILPLQYSDGEDAGSLGLTGRESFTIGAISETDRETEVTARTPEGGEIRFRAVIRIDTPNEFDYFANGVANGIRFAMKGEH